ncbi:MAG: NAD(P)/FAD-dependent oxidoreductase [Oligoflexia bacterium]|nr:NAD(P)/FAD-dependent oxidoreductase [Oligoflexia bacterium]
MTQKYDVIIIGAGMSAMAAGIRLAHYGKKTLILEKHFISGGLNSYYQRGKRKFDVGLHALTNFCGPREKRKPLTKLLKQLRIPYDTFELQEQSHSLISFPERTMKFSNDFNELVEEVAQNFPHEIDGFSKLVSYMEEYNEVALDNETIMAKDVVSKYIKDSLLIEMIFCPLLIYGSAWEDDMDFSQFVIMFKSIYLEGFSRPKGGVRTIIDTLLKRLEESECEVRFRCGVEKIITKDGKAIGVLTTKGEEIHADKILSSAGNPETMKLVNNDLSQDQLPAIGKLSFTETILCTDQRPKELGQDATIIFYNNRDKYSYRRPETLIDNRSSVICLPNNFSNDELDEGWIRLTMMANYPKWKELERNVYLEQKNIVLEESIEIAKKFLPNWDGSFQFKDVFSPTTIERYTGHFQGTVYGSTDKKRDGKTEYENLYLIGTDQGFLGIVGSMLSGVSMANLYGLMD